MYRIKCFDVGPSKTDTANEDPVNEWLETIGDIEIVSTAITAVPNPPDSMLVSTGLLVITYKVLE